MRISFLYDEVACGRHRPPLDFDDVEGNGLTGTDAVCVHYARELAARGHEVTVFAARATPTSYDGVEVQPFTQWAHAAAYYDVAIATGCPNALADAAPDTLRVVNRQCAAFGVDCVPGFESFTDIITCPSETALEFVSRGMDRSKFRVQPNGCYPQHFEGVAKIPGRCVYTSSPDRGLHLLLQAWPHIRRAVPHATLRVFYYSLDSWLRHHTDPRKIAGGAIDRECARRARYIQHALSKLTNHGIEIVGGVSHRQLEREIAQAEAFTFPCDTLAFTETFSVATLEACAAGAVPVITKADSLGQIYEGSGAQFAEGVPEFTERVIGALTATLDVDAIRASGREFAAKHTWPVLAERFESMLYEHRQALRSTPTWTAMDRCLGIERPRQQTSLPVVHMVLTEYASGGIAIDPDATKDDHGGGCRAGFVGLARALAKTGRYKVKAFAKLTHRSSKDGLAFHELHEREMLEKPAVLLAYYDTHPLMHTTGCLRIASHHTFSLPNAPSIEWADVNTAPSDYATNALRSVYGGTWRTLPNGLDVECARVTAPVEGRVIYHTSPDRGLHLLLEAWPMIRAAHPSATLHVVGDVAGWVERLKSVGSRQGDIARRVEKLLRDVDGQGVTLVGKLTRDALERELSEATCFAFPCAPALACETFSIAVAECLVRGVPVVLAPADALASLYRGAVLEAEHDPARFAESVVHVLSNAPLRAELARLGRKRVRNFTFARQAEHLDAIISGHNSTRLFDALDRALSDFAEMTPEEEIVSPAHSAASLEEMTLRSTHDDLALQNFVSATA